MTRNIAWFFIGLLFTVAAFGFAANSNRHSGATNLNTGLTRVTDTAIAAGRAIDGAQLASVNAVPMETLAEARGKFKTQIAIRSPRPLPSPPRELFLQTNYSSPTGRVLPAYVSADPLDGVRHPAIIWLSDGNSNSLGEFWKRGTELSDGSATAFRDAGVIVMFPVLRGGNTGAGGRELFYGEVDDIVAAAEQLASLGYVNGERIFLGGQGNGGTLALLTAELSKRFSGVFAFGPVAEIDHYPTSDVAIDIDSMSVFERKIRSPIHWLHGITTPTYLIEGMNLPNNRRDVESMCDQARDVPLRCVLVDDADHFSVVQKVSTVIAAQIAISESRQVALAPNDFRRQGTQTLFANADANADK